MNVLEIASLIDDTYGTDVRGTGERYIAHVEATPHVRRASVTGDCAFCGRQDC